MATAPALKSDGERLARLEATIPHLATKADIANLQSTIIKWFIGTWLATLTILVVMLAPLLIYILSRLPAA